MEPIKTVFCVEDNREIATLIRYQLKGLGYRMCGIADNEQDAVAGIRENKPDVVLIDIELNGKPEGLDIGNFLFLKTEIPFIYLTAQDDPGLLKKAESTNPEGFLLKPFDRQQLKVALDGAHGVHRTDVLGNCNAQSKGEV